MKDQMSEILRPIKWRPKKKEVFTSGNLDQIRA